MIGEKYGRLTILREAKNKKQVGKHKRAYLICLCDCGNTIETRKDHVRSGYTKSCGCWRQGAYKSREHGMSYTRFYKIWQGIKARCQNENDTNYHNYGGRGIRVCERWQIFENFRDDMYESYLKHSEMHGESNTTIDRIDNDGNYEPSNCRWTDWSRQMFNQRKRSDNVSGVVGVVWYGPRGKWRAYIGINGKQKTLGYYTDFDLAVQARKEAELKYYSTNKGSTRTKESQAREHK